MTPERPKTSTRDLGEVMAELGHWLQLRLAMDEAPVLRMAGGPDKSGFSSDTVLFDLDDSDHRGRYVLRLPPPADAYPLFPWYDLERQVERDASGASTHVGPCPRVAWYEPDSRPLGVPFFVMERVDGVPAPDMPPYVFEGWVLRTKVQERARMETGVIDALVAIHSLEAPPTELEFLELDEPGDSALRRHVEHQRTYYNWIRGDRRLALIDAVFDRLDTTWPDPDGPVAVSWGDARVANVLFHDAEPVAFLDWEAAALGPARWIWDGSCTSTTTSSGWRNGRAVPAFRTSYAGTPCSRAMRSAADTRRDISTGTSSTPRSVRR